MRGTCASVVGFQTVKRDQQPPSRTRTNICPSSIRLRQSNVRSTKLYHDKHENPAGVSRGFESCDCPNPGPLESQPCSSCTDPWSSPQPSPLSLLSVSFIERIALKVWTPGPRCAKTDATLARGSILFDIVWKGRKCPPFFL